MATTYTDLLKLPKHATSDPFDITLINNMADLVDAGMKKAYQGKYVRNLLDNSDFRNPVNQRGLTIYKGSTYAFDRWFFYSGDAEGSQVYKRDGNIGLIGGSAAASISQRFEKGILDSSKNYTLAYYDDINDKIYIKNNPVIYETERDYDRVYIAASAGASVFVRWAALYEGSYTAETLPSFQPKVYAAELAECQRYYYVIPGIASASYIGYANSTTSARITIPTPVPMRVLPTLIPGTIGNYNVYQSTNNTSTVSDAAIGDMKGNAVTLLITTTGLTAWANCVLRFNTTAALSADL